MFYDGLLLFSVLFFATALLVALHGGKAIAPHDPAYTAYLIGVSFCYFGWFWTHGGQTLGMRAWKVRVCRDDGTNLSWRRAALRFGAAGLSWLLFGLGFLWMLVDKDALTWHDRLSATRLVVTVPGG